MDISFRRSHMNNKQPSVFLTHGSPMLAVDRHAGQVFQEWGAAIGYPKAILIFSAHWETPALEFGTSDSPHEVMYDFFGFPPSLYRLQYPAPGAPWLLDRVNALLSDGGQKIRQADRELDHGVWVPLFHMWPEADVPILQMSLPQSYSEKELFALGKSLAPLRDEGVLIAGSGAATHNLREAFKGTYTEPPAWVTEFDQWLEHSLLNAPEQLFSWQSAPHALRNHPTPEHFRPLFIAMGAASENSHVSFPVAGYDMMVFSRRCIQFN